MAQFHLDEVKPPISQDLMRHSADIRRCVLAIGLFQILIEKQSIAAGKFAQMDNLGTIDILRAEVIALRVITQRLLGHLCENSTSPRSLLDKELRIASSDLCDIVMTDAFDQPSEILQDLALAHLHQMYTCQQFVGARKTRQGDRPNSSAASKNGHMDQSQ